MAANADAIKEGVVVPMTLEDYCIKPKRKEPTEPTLDSNFFDDVFDLETEDDLPTDDEDEEDDDDDDDEADNADDDSGKGETT